MSDAHQTDSQRGEGGHSPLPRHAGPESVRRRLDQVVARIRMLRVGAGSARMAASAAVVLAALYGADRLLDLPVAVRAIVGLGAVVFLGVELVRRVLRPLFGGLDRLDAARLVESRMPLEGKLVAALQLPAGEAGSLEQAVAKQAEALAERTDLRQVLAAGPSLAEVGRAAAVMVVFAGSVLLGDPYSDVFVQRWSLADVPWPRATHLNLEVPPRSPVHVVDDDGALIASRGGHVSVQVGWEGLRPERVELVVQGDEGRRTTTLSLGPAGRFMGHLTVREGDVSLLVRGGDDEGADTLTSIVVVEPPRLDDPVFTLEPPEYLGDGPSEVASDGLVVAEGTRVTLRGRPSGPTASATMWMLGSGASVELSVNEADGDQWVSGSFLAEESDTLSLVLTGSHGLATPDPGQHALVVHGDRPPMLRVHAPARSDVKVTPAAVVPVAVSADDDHGVERVTLALGDATGLNLTADPGGAWRHVLDLTALQLADTVPYEIEAVDRRDLPGKGPQSVKAHGRRIDIVEPAEVQRLLADRQLRLKEAFLGVRERQLRAAEAVDDMLNELPAADDPDLVAAVVAQNQVSSRLLRESRELCAVLEETILNRLDSGPGAEAVLQRRLADWMDTPLERGFDAEVWARLAGDYDDGLFGRLDVVGRLLNMADVALELSMAVSPRAHELLVEVRNEPSVEALTAGRAQQQAVLEGLDRLLGRMDEWEDYQEVLTLVKSLIEDQRTLRESSQRALTGREGDN